MSISCSGCQVRLSSDGKQHWRKLSVCSLSTSLAYCLTYEEDTEFFLRHARGELLQNTDEDAGFFEMAMSILEDAGYQHYEISNYARPGFASTHNRAYWLGKDYLGIGPSAFSTVGIQRWQECL